LRAAIQNHGDLTQRLVELTKAVPKAESAVFAARSGVEQTSAALEDAKRAASSQAVAAAVGKASGTAPSVAKARRALEAAQDELEIAKAAAADLSKQHKEVEQSLSMARSAVDGAIGAVVRSDPAVRALFPAYERARRQLADLRQAVELVARYFPYAERLTLLSERIEDAAPSGTRLEWERAIMVLKEDASAELPSV
jgi:hypothetical protein